MRFHESLDLRSARRSRHIVHVSRKLALQVLHIAELQEAFNPFVTRALYKKPIVPLQTKLENRELRLSYRIKHFIADWSECAEIGALQLVDWIGSSWSEF